MPKPLCITFPKKNDSSRNYPNAEAIFKGRIKPPKKMAYRAIISMPKPFYKTLKKNGTLCNYLNAEAIFKDFFKTPIKMALCRKSP